jgi:hypothetical protein
MGSQGSSHLRWGEKKLPDFGGDGGRRMGKKADSGSTGWWCSDNSPTTGRGETDADRCRGSRGGVDLLREGSCPTKQAAPLTAELSGGAPSFEW